MLGMISESKLPAVCVLLSCFMTCEPRDYLGADHAGLDALLLQRRGADGEEGRKGTEMDLKTIKSPHVVKDLYGVLEWVEKSNKMHEKYLGVCWSAPPGIECKPTGRSLTETTKHIRCRHLAVQPIINQGSFGSFRADMIVFGYFHATSSMRSPIFNTVARITRGSLRRSLLRLFCFSGDTSKCIVQ